MFSQHLFTHKYDIDALIAAFCGDESAQITQLDSSDGHLTCPAPANADASAKHIFLITPLTATFVQEVKTHPKRNKLTEADLIELDGFLAQATGPHNFPEFFETGRAGGWLRERVKEAVLDWLELNEMIPPSMRHVRDSNLFGAPPSPSELAKSTKVKIAGDV